jgi:hypothetical protein
MLRIVLTSLCLVLILAGVSQASQWTLSPRSPGDCDLKNGVLTLNPDGSWSFTCQVRSDDTGDEYDITFYLEDEDGNTLETISSHFDISVANTWRTWSDSGSYDTSYKRIKRVATSHSC